MKGKNTLIFAFHFRMSHSFLALRLIFYQLLQASPPKKLPGVTKESVSLTFQIIFGRTNY